MSDTLKFNTGILCVYICVCVCMLESVNLVYDMYRINSLMQLLKKKNILTGHAKMLACFSGVTTTFKKVLSPLSTLCRRLLLPFKRSEAASSRSVAQSTSASCAVLSSKCQKNLLS